MTTVLQHLCDKVRSCVSAAEGVASPAAILWTDPHRHFAPAIAQIKQQLPELLELGAFAEAERRGPAIWVRCIVDGALPHPVQGNGRVPIVYMPGVARQELRAGDDCPEQLRPLVELLYRGHAWVHQGGHDHTLSAYLKSNVHLGLDVAEDVATNRALANAVREVLAASVASLQGRRLEAEDFHKLVVGDTIKDLLRWIGAPEVVKQAMTPARWSAFEQSVKGELRFDLDAEGPLTAAELMCKSDGLWQKVWSRFEEAPDAYPGIVDVLSRVEPSVGGLFASVDATRFVRANDRAEADVAAALADLQGVGWAEARQAVLELERKNASRRSTVWARLSRTRWANLLEPLARLAEGVGCALGGVSPDDMVREYERSGWKTDLALLDVLAGLDGPKDADVAELVQYLAQEWLDAGARALQKAIAKHPLPDASTAKVIQPEEGCCVLFVDGLRYDLGRVLAEMLEGRGCRVLVQSRWAALPSVTATGKAAVSPVASSIAGQNLDPSFSPNFRVNGRPADAAGLRAAIKEQGGQVIGGGALPMAMAAAVGGWSETGDIDSLGHSMNAALAGQVRSEVRKIADAIQSLLASGWKKVRVVTDHGWLLLPGGLPKFDLPKHLVETKWARCALLQGATPDGVVLVHWHWNQQHTVATPPGIACYRAGVEYAHGGVSLQECLTPELTVESGTATAAAQTRIVDVAWIKFRCVVEVGDPVAGCKVDIRLGSPNGTSVIRAPKLLDEDGSASLPVEDEYESKQLVVVLLDAAGNVIAQQKTRIGDNA